MEKFALHLHFGRYDVVHAFRDLELQQEIYTKSDKQIAIPYSDELQTFDPIFAIMACIYFEIPFPETLKNYTQDFA
jgi:hypothetical protein